MFSASRAVSPLRRSWSCVVRADPVFIITVTLSVPGFDIVRGVIDPFAYPPVTRT
jgi:hypothetical protein